MTDKDLWTTFEKTGNIVDYLNYKGFHTEVNDRSLAPSGGHTMGENKFESVDHSNRNDTIRDTYR